MTLNKYMKTKLHFQFDEVQAQQPVFGGFAGWFCAFLAGIVRWIVQCSMKKKNLKYHSCSTYYCVRPV